MEKNTKSTFIYALCDPITKNEYHIYIGKSHNPNRRYKGHLKTCWNHKTKKSCWIRSLLKIGLKPDLQILEQCKNVKTIWSERERDWIKFYKKCGYKVVNGTIGGEGCSHGYHTVGHPGKKGCHFSEYLLQRIKFFKTARFGHFD